MRRSKFESCQGVSPSAGNTRPDGFGRFVERRLVHPDDPRLNAHIHAAIARQRRRGWRIDRPNRTEPIDGAVCRAMAVERAAHKPEPVQLLGWL